MSRKRRAGASLDAATMARLARAEPWAVDYLEDRRQRGIPAEGQRRWRLA